MHPAVGYRDVPVRNRPTWEGSAAQAYAEEKKAEPAAEPESHGDSSSSEDTSSSDEETPAIINNARRQASSPLARKRRRMVSVREEPVEVEERLHDIHAIFGLGEPDAVNKTGW